MRRRVWGLVAGVAPLVAAAGCLQTITAGPGEPVDEYVFTVAVTNDGDGAGRVDVVFAEGSVQDACDAALGPGDECRPFVRTTRPVASAEVRATPEPGSDFAGWSGPTCSGSSADCLVSNDSTEPDATEEVRPIFRLLPESTSEATSRNDSGGGR